MSIKDNLEVIKTDLGCHPVKIIAVTKYSTPEQMIEAYEAGLRDFGESKIQTITQKWTELPEELISNITWHFIGHLQTNKVKKVVGKFQTIQSVDSLKLADKISQEARAQNITQNILLEVNLLQEESKHGFSKEDLVSNFPEILKLDNINIKGFMTMAPFTEDKDAILQSFKGLRVLRDELKDKFNVELPELSMGMSNDYKIAIQCGSTMIRIGQKLFM